MSKVRRLEALIDRVIEAWDVLPDGEYTPREIEHWLRYNIKPAINKLKEERE